MVRLVRREPGVSTESQWDPDSGYVDPIAFDGVDAVVEVVGGAVALAVAWGVGQAFDVAVA